MSRKTEKQPLGDQGFFLLNEKSAVAHAQSVRIKKCVHSFVTARINHQGQSRPDSSIILLCGNIATSFGNQQKKSPSLALGLSRSHRG